MRRGDACAVAGCTQDAETLETLERLPVGLCQMHAVIVRRVREWNEATPRRPPLPDPMPPAYHDTIPGLFGWIDAVCWHHWPWRWHWKDHPKRRKPS